MPDCGDQPTKSSYMMQDGQWVEQGGMSNPSAEP